MTGLSNVAGDLFSNYKVVRKEIYNSIILSTDLWRDKNVLNWLTLRGERPLQNTAKNPTGFLQPIFDVPKVMARLLTGENVDPDFLIIRKGEEGPFILDIGMRNVYGPWVYEESPYYSFDQFLNLVMKIQVISEIRENLGREDGLRIMGAHEKFFKFMSLGLGKMGGLIMAAIVEKKNDSIFGVDVATAWFKDIERLYNEITDFDIVRKPPVNYEQWERRMDSIKPSVHLITYTDSTRLGEKPVDQTIRPKKTS